MDRILLVLVFPWGKFLCCFLWCLSFSNCTVGERSVAIQFGFRQPLPVPIGLRAALPEPQTRSAGEDGVRWSGPFGRPAALSSALSRPAAHTPNLLPLWPPSLWTWHVLHPLGEALIRRELDLPVSWLVSDRILLDPQRMTGLGPYSLDKVLID